MTKGVVTVLRERKARLGQFLTPPPVAGLMASMFNRLPEVVRLLDAGAGSGALTYAFVSRCCEQNVGVRAIEATLYEVDGQILTELADTMQQCDRLCRAVGILFTFSIHHADFIHDVSAQLAGDLFGHPPVVYDAAIANPPYRKINTDSAERRSLRSVGVETSNLYSGFISLIQRTLAPGGQLVGITPRSFCNGPYFRPFRADFLGQMNLRRIHLFDSRQAAFRADRVLQENVVFHAVRGERQSAEVLVSSSSGEHGAAIAETVVPFSEIVHRRDVEQIIHIPSAAEHAAAKNMMDGFDTRLDSLGLSVSTGRVVDFRLRSALRQEPQAGAVPLIYPCHLKAGGVHWPKAESRKPNAILDNDETRPWLVPAENYVLVKRFTAKEERRRLVAAVLEPGQIPAKMVGIENHLNYFHANGRGLERHLAVGLFAFLNSTLADQYFRRFSGHTQVNAADLRRLNYPSRAMLQAMGRDIPTLDVTPSGIDEVVNKHLHAKEQTNI